jgi:hypothetical protein
VDDSDDDGYTAPACLAQSNFFNRKIKMSNRRSQFALDAAAAGRQAGLRVARLTLNVIVVVSIIVAIIAVAIIPARLADWIA